MRTSPVRSPCRLSARQATSSVAVARAKSPRQYCTMPRLTTHTRPFGAAQHRLGGIEQFERTIQVAEPTDDDGEGHLQPGGQFGGAGVLGEIDARSQLDGSGIEAPELTLGDSDRPLQPRPFGEV